MFPVSGLLILFVGAGAGWGFVHFFVDEVGVGTAATGTVWRFFAGFAGSGEEGRGVFAVVGEGIGRFPDLAEGFLAEIAFDEVVIVHRFATADVSDTVDSDGGQSGAAAVEDTFSAWISTEIAFKVGVIADVVGDSNHEWGTRYV